MKQYAIPLVPGPVRSSPQAGRYALLIAVGEFDDP